MMSLKVLKSLGIVGGVLAGAAVAGAAVLLKKWKDDPDYGELRVVGQSGKGIKLSKTEDGRIVVDTHYDAKTDEAVCGDEPAPCGPVPLMDMPEKVKEITREAGADVKAAAEIAANKAGTAAEKLMEKTGETREQLREKAAAIAAQMKEKAGECCEGFQRMTQFAKEQAEAFFGAAEETAEDAKECCESCAAEAGEKAEEAAEATKEACECCAGKAAEKAEEAMEAAREACEKFAEEGSKDLEDLAEAAKDAAKEAADRILPEE